MSGMHTSDLRIPVRIEERAGIAHRAADVRIGVPLPRGLVRDVASLRLESSAGEPIPHQLQSLARWADGSAKWVLLDALVEARPHASEVLYVRSREVSAGTSLPTLPATGNSRHIEVEAAGLRFAFAAGSGAGLCTVVRVEGSQEAGTVELVLTDRGGVQYTTRVDSLEIEHQGALTTTVVVDGGFDLPAERAPIEFRARFTLHAHVQRVSLDVQLRNPQAAHHVGGLWDLGDAGSFVFGDCSVRVRVPTQAASVAWSATPTDAVHEEQGDWSLYQDSSGGECWNSINHVGAGGHSTVSFPGYAVAGAQPARVQGRATPIAQLQHAQGWVAVAAPKFWQQFPKALRRKDRTLDIALFPRECQAGFELQGGERKRHSMFIEFGATPAAPCTLQSALLPLAVSVAPQWIESTGAIPYFTARTEQSPEQYQRYVEAIIDGPESFFNKRERIDEYGWRHFGDLYADHEAVRHKGAEPFISHYNNQYDFIHGAAVHYLRSSDGRWRELMEDAARHTLDIDIYHTTLDKAAFNGGLFWHTDHYVPAVTCTHRTYSRANAKSAAYGGGPSNEHNYTSGLLQYYYLSGDREAQAAVCKLADWVIAMDDGARTLLGLVSDRPTGLASKTSDVTYHKAGRGGGNSINALLDAYAASGRRDYLSKAEALIQRCIHPRDDIAKLQLDEQPEFRWSYLVFLQVLGKYLATKLELGERDYSYQFARESLLHYARWMLAHEVPYKDVLHKVEIPTETWPAHDIRKSHVLYLAAKYASGEEREAFRARAAFFFERCLQDVCSFSTAYLTRPLVLLCVYGYVHEYFQKHAGEEAAPELHAYDFGQPPSFQSQREALRADLGGRWTLVRREVQRLFREIVYRVRWKLGFERPGRGLPANATTPQEHT